MVEYIPEDELVSRLGGYTISLEAAAKWADRLRPEKAPLQPYNDYPTSKLTLFPLFGSQNVNFRLVGNRRDMRFMFVTQGKVQRGYTDMPENQITKFEPCEMDAIIKERLDLEGITDYKFETVLSSILG